jgi:hypothetical protein
MLGAGSGDEDFLNMLQVPPIATTQRTKRIFPTSLIIFLLVYRQQIKPMAAQQMLTK